MAAARMTVLLEDPARRVDSEGQSKLLARAAPLTRWIERARAALRAAGFVIDARSPHVEVMRRSEPRSDATLATRAAALHGASVPVTLEWMREALVVPTPPVLGYGPTHATVAFFRGGLGPIDAARAVRVAMEASADSR